MPSISISILYPSEENVSGKMCRGKVCGHKVEGIDCGAEVSEWLSLSLGRPNLRMIRQTKKKIGDDKSIIYFGLFLLQYYINNNI